MSVDPSSLIFVVIIGIWAVYLLQHWVRRREQLATSRSIDRFSEAMRVLERRAPIPVALPTVQNRPYVVAPAPTSGAARATPESSSSPEVAMKQAPKSRTEQPAVRGAIARPTPAARPATSHRTHRLRALILLALVIGTPACWAAHIWGTLLLWPTLSVTALLLLDLLYVRAVARRAAARRRMAGRRAAGGPVQHSVQRSAQRSVRPSGATSPKPFPAQLARSTRSARPKQRPVAEGRQQHAAPGDPSTMVAERVVHSQEAITEVIVIEGGWEPVAVPPPTYTMKPKADRPTEAAAPLEADSDSAPSREPAEPVQPAIALDELDLDLVLERRRAAGE